MKSSFLGDIGIIGTESRLVFLKVEPCVQSCGPFLKVNGKADVSVTGFYHFGEPLQLVGAFALKRKMLVPAEIEAG